MSKQMTKKRDWGKEFVEAWNNVHEGIMIAAKIYVEAIEENPSNVEIIYKAAKGEISRADFRKLEDIGRGSLDQRLLSGGGGPHSAKINKLNKSEQTKVLDGVMFEYLQNDGQKRMVCARDCLDSEARQLFARDHIRNLPEQKAFIEEEKAKRRSDEIENYMPYEIRERRKEVYFKDAVLKFEEIRQLALQLH